MIALWSETEKYLHGDHQYMTWAACRCLPEVQQKIISREAGLLIRHFCELPDCGWPIFGTLGEWEISNRFSYNIRRDLNASYYLRWNPVTGSGKRFGHDTAGSRQAAPRLLRYALEALRNGQLRDGLAYTGAACHYIQDAVTFPEQQTLHRRSMNHVLSINIDDYKPLALFKDEDGIRQAVNKLLVERIAVVLKVAAPQIRQAMRTSDLSRRAELQRECDSLGAEITADILFTVLSCYRPSREEPPSDILEQFNNIDEEGLPSGYFIDREQAPVFQGYADVEGRYPRGFDHRRSPGLQLRLSATGRPEVRWKQSIANAVLLEKQASYCFKSMVYAMGMTGCNGVRLQFYDFCWEPADRIEFSVKTANGWEELEQSLEVKPEVNAMTVEFFSSNNSGTILLDYWQLCNLTSGVRPAEINTDKELRLSLAPGRGCYVKDESSFALQNEPITSERGNQPANLFRKNEIIFDGKSFIEIPYSSAYAPLQINGFFLLTMELFLYDVCEGEIVMNAIYESRPMSGWRMFMADHYLGTAVYNNIQEHTFICDKFKIAAEEWYRIEFELSSENKITIRINDSVFSDQSMFPRQYSNSAFFIGANCGAFNFLKGRIKNFQIRGI